MVILKRLSIELVKIQNLFTTIDFSNNCFNGEIPKSIGKLKSLKGLNMSHNKLTGNMPLSLRNLTNLEWLDISSNNFTEEILGQLVDLISLDVLSLSRNCLFGPIPQGNQFNTFSFDSYNGNLGLCGFPLAKTCGDNKGQQSLPLSTILVDNLKIGLHWKVVLLGYGCWLFFELGMGYKVFTTRKPKWLVIMIEEWWCRKSHQWEARSLRSNKSPTQKKKTKRPCRRHWCGAGQIPFEGQVRNILITLEC